MTKIKSLVDDFFKKIIKEVNAELNSRIKDPIIKSVLEGGKRLRPMLMLLTFCACNGGKENNGSYKRALEGAVSIELAHNASLVHDDIIDRDCKRRGKPALHVRNGVDAALLLGHKMIAAGFDIALNHGPDIAKVYVDTWNEALSGELMEVKMNNNGREEYSKENLLQMYYQIINQKTASLFASACMSGALEAKASWDVAKIFGEYGREIGMAYQLADDLVDLEKGERIDSVIKPLFKMMNNNNGRFANFILRRKLIKKTPKIKEIYLKEIKKHISKAEEIIRTNELIPNTKYKQLLLKAPRYIVNRMLSEINLVV
jgi:geranylgeranyl pyrophosphate synthase